MTVGISKTLIINKPLILLTKVKYRTKIVNSNDEYHNRQLEGKFI
jgi:hypothetical protein